MSSHCTQSRKRTPDYLDAFLHKWKCLCYLDVGQPYWPLFLFVSSISFRRYFVCENSLRVMPKLCAVYPFPDIGGLALLYCSSVSIFHSRFLLAYLSWAVHDKYSAKYKLLKLWIVYIKFDTRHSFCIFLDHVHQPNCYRNGILIIYVCQQQQGKLLLFYWAGKELYVSVWGVLRQFAFQIDTWV